MINFLEEACKIIGTIGLFLAVILLLGGGNVQDHRSGAFKFGDRERITGPGRMYRNIAINPYVEDFGRKVANSSLTSGFIRDRWSWKSNGGGSSISMNWFGTITGPSVTDVSNALGIGMKLPDPAVGSVPTGNNSISAGHFGCVEYYVEGYDFLHISNKTFTIGFFVKTPAGASANLSCAVSNAAKTRTYVFKYATANGTDWTWVEKTIPTGEGSGTWAYDNTTGLLVRWALYAGTDWDDATANTWNNSDELTDSAGQTNLCSTTTGDRIAITGLHIVPGNKIGQLEMRPASVEQTRCQRYWQSGDQNRHGFNVTKNGAYSNGVQFYVPMRATPTIGITGAQSASMGTVTAVGASTTGFYGASTASANANGQYIDYSWTADADLLL